MHIYGKDQQAFHLQRTEAERWWSRLNVLIVIVQLACFLAAIIRTSTNAGNSMSNSFFAISPLMLKAPYTKEGCEYNVTRTHAFFRNVTYTMRPNNVGYFVSRGALNIRYLMAITAVHVAVSMLNRLWFETNTHEIRYHFVVFRKDMMTTWEVLLMVLGMVMTWGVTKENQIMTAYLNACGGSENGSFYNSVQPYTELIVSYIVSIAVTVINALFAIWNLSEENPRVKMLREDRERQEEYQRAMREFYGLPEPTAGANQGNGNDNTGSEAGAPPQPSPQQQQPQVTYGNNRAATTATSPSAPATGVPSPHANDAAAQSTHPHHHNYHHAIRKGLGKPFTAVSHSLRGRSHQANPVAAAAEQQPQQQQQQQQQQQLDQQQQHYPYPSLPMGGPPPAELQQQQQQLLQLQQLQYQQQQLQQQQQQQQRQQQQLSNPAREPPHVGPSVSRPLTPLLNEEYDDEEGVERELLVPAPAGGRTPKAPQDRRGKAQQQQQQAPQQISSSHSGRYDLHEVDYDDEPYDSQDVDVTNSSPRGPTSSSGAGNNNNNNNVGSGRRRATPTGATTSDASTALLNARLAAAPPPPPAYSGDRRQRTQNGTRQMLAPPSPLQGGGAETDDTVLQ